MAAELRTALGWLEGGVVPAIAFKGRTLTNPAGLRESRSARLFGSLNEFAGTRSEAAMHLRRMMAARDKANYVWRRALQPNQTDNEFPPLSPRLRPVLWIVRPLRLLVKLASGF